MNVYTHTLTEIEEACGVTLDQVAEELTHGVFRQESQHFVISGHVGPALAGSVARCAFGGAEVLYVGRSLLGLVYMRKG